MVAHERNDRTGWIGIPSVPPERVVPAFLSFYLAIIIVAAVDTLLIVNNHRPGSWQLVAEAVFNDGGSIVAWSLALTWPVMEASRMVLASIFEKRTYLRGKQEGMKEGREEGKEETNRIWADWNRRRELAQEMGEVFDEPPPYDDGSRK